MPTGCQRSGFRLAVADDTGNDEIWIIKGRSVGMRKGITELAAFVD